MDLLNMIKLPEGTESILMWVIALNLFLSGLYKALEKVKDKTDSSADNKAYAVIGKVVGLLQKAIDLVSANIAHKKK